MQLSHQQYAQALFEAICETNPKDHEKVLDNFVKALAQNGHLGLFEKIAEKYKQLEFEKSGKSLAQATFAKHHSANILDDLNQIAGKKVEYQTKTDADIVGGVVIKVDQTLIDGSVKGNLNKLANELKN